MEVSRKEARESSLKYYFTFDECENGHVAERFTVSGACTECVRERNEIFIEDKKEYIVKRKTKRLNKERQKQDREAEIQRYLEDPTFRVYEDEDQYEGMDFLPRSRQEAIELGVTKYLSDKPCKLGHISARITKTNSCLICDKANKRRSRLLNPERSRVARQKRRARKFAAGGSFTTKDVQELYETQEGLCKSCSKDLKITGYHIDHIMPLVLMGRNSKENLQLLCPQCNLSKGGMHPDKWDNRQIARREECD